MNRTINHELSTQRDCPDCLGGIATAPAFEDFMHDSGLEWTPSSTGQDPDVITVDPFAIDYLGGQKI